jgi:lauroyl/myristoyl acyltransferase
VHSHDKTFEARWAHDEDDQADAEAFARFFSDEVEPEPTQQWILAG